MQVQAHTATSAHTPADHTMTASELFVSIMDRYSDELFGGGSPARTRELNRKANLLAGLIGRSRSDTFKLLREMAGNFED
jgi:hypothetical protein